MASISVSVSEGGVAKEMWPLYLTVSVKVWPLYISASVIEPWPLYLSV